MQLWIQAFSLSAKAGVLGVRRKDYRVIKFCPQDAKLRDDIVTRLVQIWKWSEVGRGGGGWGIRGIAQEAQNKFEIFNKATAVQS